MKALTYLLLVLLATGCAAARVHGRVASDPFIDAAALKFPEQVQPSTGPSDEQLVAAIHQALAGRRALLDGKCGEAQALFQEAAATAAGESNDDYWTEYRRQCAGGAERAFASGPSAQLAALPAPGR
jgi:hypothetical protein